MVDTVSAGDADAGEPAWRKVAAGGAAYDVVHTSIGSLHLVVGPAGVLSCTFAQSPTRTSTSARAAASTGAGRQAVHDPGAVAPVLADLEAYLAGPANAEDATPGRHELTTPVDLTLATAWQRRVFEALMATTGYGQVTTYAALAQAVGRPSAARAVGAALRTNPVCLFVPCHRVVGAGGQLTGYAGGVAAKQALLTLEGAMAGSARARRW